MYGALITEPDFNVKLVQFVFKVRSYFRWGVIELCSWEKYNEQTLLLSYKIYLQLQILPFRLFCQQNSDQLTRPLITAICRYGSCCSELVMYQAVWEQTGGLHSWARYFGITTQVSFHQGQSTDNLILQGRAGTPPPLALRWTGITSSGPGRNTLRTNVSQSQMQTLLCYTCT